MHSGMFQKAYTEAV